jgi:hypothetical protein
MSTTQRVKVPPKGDYPDRREAQLQKGDRLWGGSVERSRGPMDKNRIRGNAERGERAQDRKAPIVKAQAVYMRRSCGEG